MNLSQGLVKICDSLLNSSWDHFGLHQGKNIRVTMESKDLKRHILRPTLSIDGPTCFALGEVKDMLE